MLARGRETLAEGVIHYAREFRAERLLVQPNDPIVWLVANRIAHLLDVPASVLLLDPPGYLIARRGADRATRGRLTSEFCALMRRSCRTACASPAMADSVQMTYGRPTSVLFHGLEAARWERPKTAVRHQGALRIGFAGSLYATDAWNSFVAALDSAHWTIGGRRVAMTLIGPVSLTRVGRAAHFDVRGWMDQAAVIDTLADMDLLYLPYWFAPQYREVSEMSFPTKLATYMAAGVPVFFHGPEYSGPSRFVKEQRIGTSCSSLGSVAIAVTLERMLEAGRYASYADRIARVRAETFSATTFRRSAAWVLGLDETELAARPDPICDCGLNGSAQP